MSILVKETILYIYVYCKIIIILQRKNGVTISVLVDAAGIALAICMQGQRMNIAHYTHNFTQKYTSRKNASQEEAHNQ